MSDKQIQITEQGRDELSREFKELLEVKRPAGVIRVGRARDFGDLSENAEYHAAREDLNFIDGRIEELENILARAKVVSNNHSKDRVGLGCKVTVRTGGKDQEFWVVGDWEADPAKQKISHESPLGKSLVGKRIGDEVKVEAPVGSVTYTIKKIH